MEDKDLKTQVEFLKTKLKHLENDYYLMKEEKETSAGKYLEILLEIKKKNEALEKEITEREQMEQMLIQSEKMSAIGLLAAGVAHEINNPIGYINSNLRTLEKYSKKIMDYNVELKKNIESWKEKETADIEMLSKEINNLKKKYNIDYVTKDLKAAIEESLEGTEKVKRIVLDLRDFSREGKAEFKLADINTGIEKTLNVIWNELKYKAEVIKEYGEIPQIECEIQRLGQVFMNLLVNAAQAIEKRGTIIIKTFCEDEQVVIQISDTGKGIPNENMKRLFDAFFTTKEPGKGTGLGLSISYRIIHEHNGTISVESEVGKGTTFTVKLPIIKSEVIKDYKILIADDDESYRKLLRRMIDKYDPSFLIKEAKNGFEAADLLNSFEPDVVFMDINMPGMNGINVCRRIRNDKKMKKMKIVMNTGMDREDLREKSLKAGANYYMEKTGGFEILHSVLDKIIKE